MINSPIIYNYVYPLVNPESQTEVFNRPSIELTTFYNNLKSKRHVGYKDEWQVWRTINGTGAYNNEYIGRWVMHFGKFNEL